MRLSLALVGVLGVIVTCLGGLASSTAWAQDRHEGYYYPDTTSEERYVARVPRMERANRRLRVGFVTQMTTLQLRAAYAPVYAMFAKGTEAEKMIVVALDDDVFRTLFRARAFLAQMTAVARTTEFFRDTGSEEDLTFLDLLKMLGFRQLTISDGTTYAHRIYID